MKLVASISLTAMLLHLEIEIFVMWSGIHNLLIGNWFFLFAFMAWVAVHEYFFPLRKNDDELE